MGWRRSALGREWGGLATESQGTLPIYITCVCAREGTLSLLPTIVILSFLRSCFAVTARQLILFSFCMFSGVLQRWTGGCP